MDASDWLPRRTKRGRADLRTHPSRAICLKHHIPVRPTAGTCSHRASRKFDPFGLAFPARNLPPRRSSSGPTSNIRQIHNIIQNDWTEHAALLREGAKPLPAARPPSRSQRMLPFRHTRSEFINWHLQAWCERKQIQLTPRTSLSRRRQRAYRAKRTGLMYESYWAGNV